MQSFQKYNSLESFKKVKVGDTPATQTSTNNFLLQEKTLNRDSLATLNPVLPVPQLLQAQLLNCINMQLLQQARQMKSLSLLSNLLAQKNQTNTKVDSITHSTEIKIKDEPVDQHLSDKEDDSTTMTMEEKHSTGFSLHNVESEKHEEELKSQKITRSDFSSTHPTKSQQDQEIDVKCEEESIPQPQGEITEPALFAVTKVFPDWDLIKILDYCYRGKKVEDPVPRNLRHKDQKKEEVEDKPSGEPEGDYLTEEEVTLLVATLCDKLKELLGFSNLNQDKVLKILEKNGMDIKRTISLIKKNVNFYKKYFQPCE